MSFTVTKPPETGGYDEKYRNFAPFWSTTVCIETPLKRGFCYTIALQSLIRRIKDEI
jgi:hypothetical protein